jgi:hypothetical protein
MQPTDIICLQRRERRDILVEAEQYRGVNTERDRQTDKQEERGNRERADNEGERYI